MATTRLYTAEDLEAMGSDAPYVVIDGRLVHEEMESGGRSSELAALMITYLNVFVRTRRLGKVYGADGTFILRRNPDTVLVPDGAFVRADRLPQGDDRGFLPLAPDIAIDVLFPSNRAADTTRKLMLYLTAGTRLVWVIDPDARTLTVHAPDAEPRVLHEHEMLDGGAVLSGFELALSDLFSA